MLYKKVFRVFCLLIVLAVSVEAQELGHFDGNDSLPIDRSIRFGRLSNGFTYAIKHNKFPRGRIYLRLVVKAGSVFEGPGQMELAHLLEHMVFKGTKNFEKVWSFLDSLGGQKGLDVNAVTGLMDTYYFFNVPNDDLLFQRGLLLLRDVCHGINLNPKSVDEEKNVVINEIRNAGGNFQYVKDIYYPKIVKDSIQMRTFGTSEEKCSNLDKVDYRLLKKFYEDWYRPDLQHLIVVGDVDVNEADSLVKAMFSTLPIINGPAPIVSVPSDENHSDQIFVIPNTDLRNAEVRIYLSRPSRGYVTLGDLKSEVISQLYVQMMKDRFVNRTNQYLLPFRNIYHSLDREYVLNWDAIYSSASVKGADVKNAFKTLWVELERVKRYGFGEGELLNAKRSFVKKIEGDDSVQSSELISRLHERCVHGSATPTLDYEKRAKINIMESLSSNDVNDWFDDWMRLAHCDILFLTSGNDVDLIDSARQWIADISGSVIDRYIPNSKLEKDDLFSGFSTFNESDYVFTNNLRGNVLEANLSNGVKVILKRIPGDRSKRIQLHAFSKSDLLCSSEIDRRSALFAGEYVRNAGIGALNKFDLNGYLTDLDIQIYPYINERTVGVISSSTYKRLDSMLQLVYLCFTSPRYDSLAFNDWFDAKRSQLAIECLDSYNQFDGFVDSVRSAGISGRYFISPDLNKSVTLDELYGMYNKMFSNRGNFVFVITGDFDSLEVVSLLAKYIGAIPKLGSPLGGCESRVSVGKDVTYVINPKVKRDKATVRMIFSVDPDRSFVMSQAECNVFNTLAQIVLERRLREREAGTYNVTTQVSRFGDNGNRFQFELEFNCLHKDVDRMIRAATEELSLLQDAGAIGKEIEWVLDKTRRDFLMSFDNSIFWNNYLVQQYVNHADLNEIFGYMSDLDRISKDRFVSKVKLYFRKASVSRFLLLNDDTQ